MNESNIKATDYTTHCFNYNRTKDKSSIGLTISWPNKDTTEFFDLLLVVSC